MRAPVGRLACGYGQTKRVASWKIPAPLIKRAAKFQLTLEPRLIPQTLPLTLYPWSSRSRSSLWSRSMFMRLCLMVTATLAGCF